MANINAIRTTEAFTAIASEYFIPKFVSQFYKFSPILSALTQQPGSDRELRPKGNKETPGSVRSTFIGGGNIPTAEKMSIKGSLTAEWGVQTGTSGGVKNLSARDTSAQLTNPLTNSQDNKEVKTYLNFSLKQVECIIWNNTLRLGRGQYKLTASLENATGIAMQDMLDDLIEELFMGRPTDQTAAVWDSQSGLINVCEETGLLYGIDRTANSYFRSHLVSTAKAAALALIDDANITQGIRAKNTRGVNFGIFGSGPWLQIRNEATTKGLGFLIQEGNPLAARYGILNEAVAYNTTVLTWDPGMIDYGASGSTSGGADLRDWAFLLDLGDWFFQTNEGYNFEVGEFVDISKYTSGGYDARRSLVTLMYRLGCYRPWNQIAYTGVTYS